MIHLELTNVPEQITSDIPAHQTGAFPPAVTQAGVTKSLQIKKNNTSNTPKLF